MKLIFILLCAYFGNALWVREMENQGLFQGDMVMRPDQMNAITKNGSAFGSIINYRWPNAIVPYYINNNIGTDGAKAVNDAIADYHKHTCLKFVKRTNQREYLHFQNGGGCSSPVGYNNPQYTSNGVNVVTLGQGCRIKGIAMHEIGHSIGLYHEQSRPDRDSFVQILAHNVFDPLMKFNFDKYSTNVVNSLGFDYDYDSMMHYDRTAFGCDANWRNCKDTIRTVDASKQNTIGQRNGFSTGDINQINKMYNCQSTGTDGGSCADKHANCQYWAGNGECTKNPSYMSENCKKSCAQVNGDLNSNCAAWAKSGECQKNSAWMLANCKKSCDVC